MLFKLKLSGEADLADLVYILRALNVDSSQFLYICIIAGCNFLPNIKGIGIHQASQVVTRKDILIELGSHQYAPSDNCKGFKQHGNQERMRHNFLRLVESILYLIIDHKLWKIGTSWEEWLLVTSSFKYTVLTGSGRCLKNPHISQIGSF